MVAILDLTNVAQGREGLIRATSLCLFRVELVWHRHLIYYFNKPEKSIPPTAIVVFCLLNLKVCLTVRAPNTLPLQVGLDQLQQRRVTLLLSRGQLHAPSICNCASCSAVPTGQS